MDDQPDRPLSSDEMLERFRREVRAPRPDPVDHEWTDDGGPSTRPPPPQARAAQPPGPAPRARPRPGPPRRPPPQPAAQRRAVLTASIALALVIFGMVAALTLARV